MLKYTDVIQDQDIINKYEYIESKNDSNISIGLKHINNVIDICKKIASILGIDEKEKNNLLIAAALHDIGKISNLEDHNYQSFNYSYDYLRYKVDIKDRNVIAGIILRHSNSSDNLLENILFIANALDITRKRLIDPFKLEDNIYNKIKEVEISKESDYFFVNVITFNNIIIDVLKFDDIIIGLKNICDYFNLNYKILVNDKEVLIESKVK